MSKIVELSKLLKLGDARYNVTISTLPFMIGTIIINKYKFAGMVPDKDHYVPIWENEYGELVQYDLNSNLISEGELKDAIEKIQTTVLKNQAVVRGPKSLYCREELERMLGIKYTEIGL